MKKVIAAYLLLSLSFSAAAQPPPAYPSLLWEISGNGLQKPSYLFGSMHVSSKTVFHLSDSFYTAIAACEMVALELDPAEWQPDMYRLRSAQDIIGAYYSLAMFDYLRPNDFRLKDYTAYFASALREEPADINGLLYRTSPMMADYEENTYLDLYVYQTGRRLGLKAAGVETLPESERMMEEANLAFMKEKVRPKVYPPDENMFTLPAKLEEAYRHGNLDLLDSLNNLLLPSKTYTEIFLYDRDEIQARAIDSIIRHHTLFVAVGAAHLER
jgi:uncharacterized protein YbaP (TraB family)